MQSFIIVSIYLLLSITGLILIKYGASNNYFNLNDNIFNVKISIVSLIGLVMYVFSFLLWLTILQNFNLSYIVPVIAGVSLCLTTVISYFVLKENISVLHAIGIAVVIIGVVLINIKH